MVTENISLIQLKRRDFALKVVHLFQEMDNLLIEEVAELESVSNEQLAEILYRKIHVGGIPYCLRRNASGFFEPNETWISQGYFGMKQNQKSKYG